MSSGRGGKFYTAFVRNREMIYSSTQPRTRHSRAHPEASLFDMAVVAAAYPELFRLQPEVFCCCVEPPEFSADDSPRDVPARKWLL